MSNAEYADGYELLVPGQRPRRGVRADRAGARSMNGVVVGADHANAYDSLYQDMQDTAERELIGRALGQ